MIISGCLNIGLLSPPIATGVTTNLTSLQDSLSNLERVLNTPLPFAYQVHLRMSVWYVFLKNLAWETFLNALIFLGYISFSCLCVIPSFRFFPYRSWVDPNIGSFWVCDHPSDCLCCLPIPWFPWNWSRNVSCFHSGAYTEFFSTCYSSENPFNYDLNDLGMDRLWVMFVRDAVLIWSGRFGPLLSCHSTGPSLDHSGNDFTLLLSNFCI
jgi:hypothetical protein